MVAAKIPAATSNRAPPACHAPATGALETNTAAKPPSAAKPITPALNSPA